MKKILMHICLFVMIISSVFIMNEKTVNAASKLEVRVNSSMSVKLTERKPIDVSVYYNGKDVTGSAILSYESSNTSVLDIGDSSNWGSSTVLCPIKKGKSVVTITATYQPLYTENYEPEVQAKAQCTVNVQYHKSIRAHACLIDYNTRNNTFVIKVKNISSKNITILSKGAKALDCDYKKYDRKLRIKGKSKVVIKPGQTKKVRFKVVGKLTWYDFEDFTIRSYWKWGKKKYLVSVDSDEGMFVKRGKKWKWGGYVDDEERWFEYEEY